MRFRVICAILLAMYLLVSGCQRESAKIPESEEPAESAETHETDSHETERTQETNTHETESTFVRSDQEIREIVEDALLRGEDAFMMHLYRMRQKNTSEIYLMIVSTCTEIRKKVWPRIRRLQEYRYVWAFGRPIILLSGRVLKTGWFCCS